MKLRNLYYMLEATTKVKLMFEFSMRYYEYDNIEDYFDRNVYGINPLDKNVIGIQLEGKERY